MAGQYSKEEAAANIGALEKFKQFRTIDTLSGGDPTKYEQILQIDYATIFMKLYYDKESNAFQDRYQEVIKRESKRGLKK